MWVGVRASAGQQHWSTAKDLLVQTDGRLLELMDHGELSMDAPATLAAFLERGLKRYPAKRTMLVLRAHTYTLDEYHTVLMALF